MKRKYLLFTSDDSSSKPCAFFQSVEGCINGRDCIFSHDPKLAAKFFSKPVKRKCGEGQSGPIIYFPTAQSAIASAKTSPAGLAKHASSSLSKTLPNNMYVQGWDVEDGPNFSLSLLLREKVGSFDVQTYFRRNLPASTTRTKNDLYLTYLTSQQLQAAFDSVEGDADVVVDFEIDGEMYLAYVKSLQSVDIVQVTPNIF